jgi:phage baseplate assembly protein V
MIKYGKVEEVDYANAKVKVRIGELLTAWIPWTTKSSNTSTWLAPEINEQVVVASPSGELNQGVIIGSIPQDLHPPVGNSVDKHRIDYGNGDFFEYDRAAGSLDIHVTGNLTINVGGTVTVVAQTINLN